METLSDWFTATFAGAPVMAILRGFTPERTVELATAAWDLGVTCVEVPVQDDSGLDALTAAVAAGRRRGMPVGAGTVTTTDRLRWAHEAGAAFTVAPGLEVDVARASIAVGLPHLPGVATASEVQEASALGFYWLKAFPASVLGTAWFRAMRGPFPETDFVATGGMDAANAAAYLDAGASVVAVGSALEDPASLAALSALVARAAAPPRGRVRPTSE